MIRKLSGFSLIEVAMVLCIIGILSGIGIPALNNFLKFQKIRKTEDHMEQIFQSLTSYVLVNKRLPCPSKPGVSASENGISESNCLFSETFIGLVPYRTLGIPEKTAKDSYHNWITFAVNPSLTDSAIKSVNASYDSDSPNTVFCEVEKGHIDLKVTNSEKQSVLDPESSNDLIAVLLISHGTSGGGSFKSNGDRKETTSPDKTINADATPNFVDRRLSLAKENFFDDTVKWITRDNLMALYGKQPCKRR
ncbi:MAG: prepilin-type N-terminal cleavage/methylation domain-containing protein [Alphaproteobacteria bacterium]|nr:prepilin-type N-terminal cleavage/methylation domain-containing protein [Alphaproteobacteria bacterium]